MSENKPLSFHAVVELFGHARIAGLVTEQVIGGETFIRVDVPKEGAAYTRLLGKGAIYAINICDEPLATRMAQRITPPLQPFVDQLQWEADQERRRAAAALTHDPPDGAPVDAELSASGERPRDPDEDEFFSNVAPEDRPLMSELASIEKILCARAEQALRADVAQHLQSSLDRFAMFPIEPQGFASPRRVLLPLQLDEAAMQRDANGLLTIRFDDFLTALSEAYIATQLQVAKQAAISVFVGRVLALNEKDSR